MEVLNLQCQIWSSLNLIEIKSFNLFYIMPKLNLPQEQILAKIKTGTSFVKVVPDNIGDIVYFDTTNTDNGPQSRNVYVLRKLIVIVLTIAALVAVWQAVSLGWAITWTFVIGCAGLAGYNLQSFHGTDYFVGTEGFAVFNFKDTRDNITAKDIHRFDASDFLIHKEEQKFVHGVYNCTNYSFAFLSPLDSANVCKTVYEIMNDVYRDKNGGPNTKNIKYDFLYQIEKAYSHKILNKCISQLDSEGKVTFYVVSDMSIMKGTYKLQPILHLSPIAIKYNNAVYNKENSGTYFIRDGILYLERMVELKGVIAKGPKKMTEEIPLDKIVNRDAFLTLLSQFYNPN